MEEKRGKLNKANETDVEGGKEDGSLEDGCSSATFAPGGTAVGETRVEQEEASAKKRNGGKRRRK